MKKFLSAIFILAIPIVAATAAIISINSNKKCGEIHNPAVIRSGYETEPATVTVEASPSIQWNEMGGHSTFLIVLGYILFIASGFVPSILEENGVLDTGKRWLYGLLIVAACWILGFLAVMGKYSFLSDAKYTETVKESDYKDCKEVFSKYFVK